MSFLKMKRDKADALFSLFIRERDSWTCQKCGRKFEKGAGGLGASHFFKRALEATRFDPENADALCNMPCHANWEHEKMDRHTGDLRAYGQWKLNRLGAKRFTLLEFRAYAKTKGKRDRKLAFLKVQALMEALKKERGESIFGSKA